MLDSDFRAEKDKDATLDYAINWRKYWLDDDDDIDSSSWEIEESTTTGIDLNIESSQNDVDSTKVLVSGGSVGQEYRLRNRITTVNGLEDDRTLTILVVEN